MYSNTTCRITIYSITIYSNTTYRNILKSRVFLEHFKKYSNRKKYALLKIKYFKFFFKIIHMINFYKKKAYYYFFSGKKQNIFIIKKFS